MVTIRRANSKDAPGIARVRVDTWRSAYSGLLPVDYLDSLDYQESARQFMSFFNHEPEQYVIYVAEEDSGNIVGFACGGPERKDSRPQYGEIYAIYVSRAYQRQGLGAQLMTNCARSFRADGMSSMVLWVLADNPFRGFYEMLNGQKSGNDYFAIQDLSAPLLAYEWPDLNSLTKE